MANESLQEAKAEHLAGLVNLKEQAMEGASETDEALDVLDGLTHLFFILSKGKEGEYPGSLGRLGNYASEHLFSELHGVGKRLSTIKETAEELESRLKVIWQLERSAQQ